MSATVLDQLRATLGGAYTIERELGGGGMSRVFVARETALDRTVVVKVVAPDLIEGVSAERFAREVKLAARLQQANIVPVLAAGSASGLPYYTMPFVRGESLRARLALGERVSVADALHILRDVARALAYAHDEGVVHRDIKPENILLSGGTAVVTDFGIAKAISAARGGADHPEAPPGPKDLSVPSLTQVGMSLGTPAYMAPEQALGDPGADHRADLYAWGLVAWELLTGAHPFAGRTTLQAMVSAQISESPPPVGSRRTDVPAPLAALVMRALEKDPARRPQSAREVLSALDALATPSAGEPGSASSRVTGSRPVPRRWSRGLLAVTLLAATVGSAIVFRARSAARGADAGSAATVASPADALTSLAVLPFVNTSGDAKDEYFSDGMTDELAHALSKLPGLRLAGRSSSFAFKGKNVPASDVGKTLGVGAIIEGTVRRSGDRLRVTAQLTSTRDGRVIWSDGFEREGPDVFAVQDAFTSAIVGALTPMLGGAPTTSTASAVNGADTRGTADAQAYDLYLRGRYFWAQRGAGPLDTAVALFSQAVQRDPRFARGWAGLAVAHVMRPNFNALVPALPAFDSAEAAARRALAIDSGVADAHAAMGMSQLRRLDLQAAGEAFARARLLEPQNATVHHWSALYFGVLGDTAQADRELDAAVSLDPLSATTLNSRATALSDRRRFAEAFETFARVTALSGKFSSVFSNSNRALIWTGRADSTLRLQRVRMRETTVRGRFGGLLLAAAAAGQWDEARQMRATIQRGGDPSILVFDRAVAELVFGDRTRAADLFVQSIETEGTLANVMFSLCDPILDPIRDERVFVTFRERHGLRDCPYRSPWPIGTPPAEGR